MTPEDVEEWYRARFTTLVRFATFVGSDPGRSEDAAQAAITAALAREDGFGAVTDLDRYVRRSIVNHVIDARRHAARRHPISTPDEGAADPNLGRVDDADVAWRVIRSLPDRQRTALVLRYVEDYSDEDIAYVLECRPATVRSLVARSIARVRSELIDNPEFGDHQEVTHGQS